jgi:hypothetical protein
LASQSLSRFQPENVAHGTEIQVVAYLGNGAPVILAEVYEMDYDEEWGIHQIPTLGSKIAGSRDGRYKLTGTIKSYWINQSIRSMLSGISPTTAGMGSVPIYHSQRPFQRYNIRCSGLPGLSTVVTFFNVVFEKDVLKWTEANFTEETINFTAEDILESPS